MKYIVRYVAGPYSGTKTVNAEDEDQAIAIVRSRVRCEMMLPLYSDSYRVVETEEETP